MCPWSWSFRCRHAGRRLQGVLKHVNLVSTNHHDQCILRTSPA
ncbi:hypothetical protein ACFFX0_12565 [Citricoccus parietis]|uniref:Uncharacterized protein n=1 Tax=Citricoccus parietis TaxID=592307 RepID=A0ABV5FZ91_9MICC